MKRTLLAIAIGAISAGLVGGALAQDDETATSGDTAESEEQATETQQAQEESERPEEAQEAAAEEGEQPDVSVSEEELPDDGVDAEDYEEASDEGDRAETNGEEAPADAAPEAAGDDEEMQTDPGEQATSAEPDAQQQDTEGDQAQEDEQAAEGDDEAGFEESGPQEAPLDSTLASMQVSEIEGMTIVNAEGETIGEARSVLRHDDSGDLHVVVTVGGFWIFGGSDVALPLADMQVEGEQLVLQQSIGEEELDALSSDYDEDRYSEVDGDMTLSEATER
ncbi:hypothetical protein HNO51_17175 [Billgrantia sulfidoxydans]|uniref:PRC-barrel domain-containing protein n=1 Tax=Billgrantia sulfidoxydans TaxID=2733484 RepID=A0ABX7W9L1_9GAMM|nr:PRC-barrel domain-containing protein [Halomonas sulfidoxydans]QTP56262.1 hypothetical protein HNO51_17175 [Halomonas sulfidoxydans]